MQEPKQTIRPWFAVVMLLIAAAGLLAVREYGVSRQIQTLRAERQQLLEEQEAFKSRIQQAEASVAAIQSQLVSQPIQTVSPGGENPQVQKQFAALETRIRELQASAARRPAGPFVSEYDPTNPQAQSSLPEPPANAMTNSMVMRSWGQEQALGVPNTERAGDLPTAWASRDPDGGPEWLAVGFESAVDLAEVRIRETFNPGAISKVTALQNGQEVVLWEGTAEGGVAPRDFVLPVSGNIRADSIVVHLDTTRVPGWNEIDAVELVGRDGSRQWASSASASTTYAEPRGSETPPTPGARR